MFGSTDQDLRDICSRMYQDAVYANGSYSVNFDELLRKYLSNYRPLDKYDHDILVKSLKWGQGLLPNNAFVEKSNDETKKS